MKKETIGEFVRRIRLERGFSTADVARRSRGTITDAYISRIENGYVKNVSIEKLQALAECLAIQENTIIRVATGLSSEQPTEVRMVMAEAFGGETLPDWAWEEIEAVIRTMIENKVKLFREDPLTYHDMLKLGPTPFDNDFEENEDLE